MNQASLAITADTLECKVTSRFETDRILDRHQAAFAQHSQVRRPRQFILIGAALAFVFGVRLISWAERVATNGDEQYAILHRA